MNVTRLLACVVFGVAAGCGKPETPRGAVRGRVTMDGKPLGGVSIVFENKGLGVSQAADVGADGSYQVATYAAGGLPVGKYGVCVVSGRLLQPGEEIPLADAAKNAPSKKPPLAVPDKYRRPETSGLSAEVKEGANPPFDFDLKP